MIYSFFTKTITVTKYPNEWTRIIDQVSSCKNIGIEHYSTSEKILIGKSDSLFLQIPKVGEKFTAGDGYIFGKNLELEKGKKIVREWKTTEGPPNSPPSTFQLTFRKIKKGTEITMVYSNVPVEEAEDIKQGWIDFYWEPLKEYFKGAKQHL